jgi:FtsP/CotA-like multicopper oxidase with cupredoxin domain
MQNPTCQLSDPRSPDFGTNCCVRYGTVTFRTHFDPVTVGRFVMHCHILTHEDIGMMQLLEIHAQS